MLSRQLTQNREFEHQYFFFQMILALGDFLLWGFYLMLLLRQSNNSIDIVFINQGVVYIFIFLGIATTAKFIHRVGYLHSFRIHNILMVAMTVLCVLTIDRAVEMNILIAALRGFIKGIYFMNENLVLLRENTGMHRARTVSLVQSIGFVLEVTIPILSGAVISNLGYELILWIAAAAYLIGAIYPWKYNRKPKEQFHMSEIIKVANHRGFKRYSVILFVGDLMANIRANVLLIVPFLFFGDELQVGAFTSLIGLIAALLAFIHRRDRGNTKVRWGMTGASILSVVNLSLLWLWSIPGLVIYAVGTKLGSAFFNPVMADLDLRNRELLLGEFKHESNAEIIVYSDFVFLLSRITCTLLFLFLFFGLRMDSWLVLQVLFGLTALREIVVIAYGYYLNHVLKKGPALLQPKLL